MNTCKACGLPATPVRLTCPAGRPDASGGPYCDLHGGADAARGEAEADWNYLAPESVGGVAAVLRVGSLCLDTRDAYLVLRHEGLRPEGLRPEGPDAASCDSWLAFLGLGPNMVIVPVPGSCSTWGMHEPEPEGVPHRRRGEKMSAWRRRCATVGRCRFDTKVGALLAGRAAWLLRVQGREAEIRAARGGTLEWGVSVEPLDEPVVVEVGTGQNAWDAASELQRRSPLAYVLSRWRRPSGEVP